MKEGLLNNKNAQRGATKRDARINLRVQLVDKVKWQETAKKEGLTLAAWIEKTLNSYIKSKDKDE